MKLIKVVLGVIVSLLLVYGLLCLAPPFSVGIGGGVAIGDDAVVGGQIVIEKKVLQSKGDKLVCHI